MTTDIVERLREFAPLIHGAAGATTAYQAANEIESLRARLAEMEKQEPVGFVAHGSTLPPTMRVFEGCSILNTEEASDYIPACITALYLHPDPASAARIAELEREVEKLQERQCEVCGYAEHHREHTGCLRKTVEQLQSKLRLALDALEYAVKQVPELGTVPGVSEALAVLKSGDVQVCNWEHDDDDGCWTGDCGIAFCIEHETPEKNDMAYCPKCGRKIVAFSKAAAIKGEQK